MAAESHRQTMELLGKEMESAWTIWKERETALERDLAQVAAAIDLFLRVSFFSRKLVNYSVDYVLLGCPFTACEVNTEIDELRRRISNLELEEHAILEEIARLTPLSSLHIWNMLARNQFGRLRQRNFHSISPCQVSFQ